MVCAPRANIADLSLPSVSQSLNEDAPEPPPSMQLPAVPRHASALQRKTGKVARSDGFWVTGAELPDNPHRTAGPR